MLARVGDPGTGRALRREDFWVSNVLRCRPPDNLLTGAYYEDLAITQCSPYLEKFIEEKKPRAIIALGNQPLRWFTNQWGIEKLRGYIFETKWGPVVGTYHPAYIMRGQFHLARVFELDILKSLFVTRHGVPRLPKTYLTSPSLGDAQAFAARYFAAGMPPLAFDIETPYARIEKDADITVEPSIEDDVSYKVLLRISFSFEDGVALSIPWQPPFIEIAQQLLASGGDKIVWNRHFDVPRLGANNCPVLGRVYDGMDAFHFLEPSLPMGLKYAATFYCPDMPPWKLMSQSSPEWYNAADSDVARRVFLAVRDRLLNQGRWTTFERHFVDLGLVLQTISAHGILVDGDRRREERTRFETQLAGVVSSLQALVPQELRPRKVYKLHSRERLEKEGKWQEGLMVKVTRQLTPAEISRSQKKLEREKEKAQTAALRLQRKEEKRQQKLLEAQSGSSASKNRTPRARRVKSSPTSP